MNFNLLDGSIESNTDPLDIGFMVAPDNAFYKGIVDDIRIYNRVLNEQEIQTLIDISTGKPNIKKDAIEFYPNPTNKILYINGLELNNTVTFFDLSGKIVLQQINVNDPIDLTNLKSGTYIIKIEEEKNLIINKFIKQ